MVANTVLLDFSIDPSRIADEKDKKQILKEFKEILVKYFPQLKLVYDMETDDGYLCILTEPEGVVLTIRFFNQGLITLNIEYFREVNQEPKITFDVSWGFFFRWFPPLVSHVFPYPRKQAPASLSDQLVS